jgi:hypothetical protein
MAFLSLCKNWIACRAQNQKQVVQLVTAEAVP